MRTVREKGLRNLCDSKQAHCFEPRRIPRARRHRRREYPGSKVHPWEVPTSLHLQRRRSIAGQRQKRHIDREARQWLTLNPSFELDPLVNPSVDLNTSISKDIADGLSCYLDVRDQRVGLLNEDHLWCGTGVDRQLNEIGIVNLKPSRASELGCRQTFS